MLIPNGGLAARIIRDEGRRVAMNERRPKPGLYSFGECIVDTANQSVFRGGREVEVQRRVFALLRYLIEHRERVVSKDELLDVVWAGRVTTEGVLSRAVMKARQAVGDDAHAQAVIKTMHGQGYRFVARLREPVATPRPPPSTTAWIHWRLPRPLSWLALLALSGAWFIWAAISGSGEGGLPDLGNPNISVQPWRRAEALFQQDLYWQGGDGAVSVDLGAGRVAWFFGDSFVAAVPQRDREDSVMVRNSVAIQQGYDPAAATLEFHWRGSSVHPASFFPERGENWYWPTQAILVDQTLVVFLVESRPVPSGLGFEHLRMVAALIRNPSEPPEAWLIEDLELPGNDVRVLPGYSAIVRQQAYLYAYGKQEGSQDVYLARWVLADLVRSDAATIDWWCGENEGWQRLDTMLNGARPVMTDSPTPFSIRFHDDSRRFLALDSWGFGSAVIALRTSPGLTGPWSERQVIYHPEEEFRSGVLIYGARIHDALPGADFVVTYDVNHEVFSELVNDMSIYFPRFLRIDIARAN